MVRADTNESDRPTFHSVRRLEFRRDPEAAAVIKVNRQCVKLKG
jgi:hypothetical protein